MKRFILIALGIILFNLSAFTKCALCTNLAGVLSIPSRYSTIEAALIPQYLNTSIPQYLNTSIPQYLNTSIPQYLNTSIPQYLNTSI
jgi:hypothetical protein